MLALPCVATPLLRHLYYIHFFVCFFAYGLQTNTGVACPPSFCSLQICLVRDFIDKV